MEKQYKKSLWNNTCFKTAVTLIGVYWLSSCTSKTAFEITEEPFGEISQVVLKNKETGEYVSVLPSFGATLNQVALRKDMKVYELVEGCTTYEELLNEGKNTFKGSKLFPFPNRIRDGKYSLEDKEYQFPLNFPQENNAIHGLVLTEKFEVINRKADDEQAVVSLQYKFNKGQEGYPFSCILTLHFELSRKGFSCRTEVVNTDSVTVPVGEGWHPYFKTGSKVDELVLKLPSDSLYLVDERMIPTLAKASVNGYNLPKKIGADKFDTGYKVNEQGPVAQTEINDPAQNITLIVWQETGLDKYNYLQVYTPPGRTSIAVEPMTCLADAFNNRQGLILLPPGQTRSFTFGVRLE